MLEHFSDTIISFLDKNSEKTVDINVVGDVIFDEYYDVEVDRISPEFPIPVYKSSSFDPTSGIIPGGAANVAYQFKHFNVNSELISLLNKIGEVNFDSKGISTKHSKIVHSITIPTKRRIYSHGIPLVRHDIEKENYGLEDLKRHLFDLTVPEGDFTIFSDYSKGLFCVPWFRKYITKTKNIVDPKNNFIDLWEGCTYFKPNALEAERLSERKNISDQIEFFMDALKCEGVLITRSGSGVTGKECDGKLFEVVPNVELPPPESVIGAGDCFVSFIAMALARGFSLEKAAQIGFVAGTAYVHKRHNAPLSPAELASYVGIKEIKSVDILKNRNFNLVFTNGCFDLGLTQAHVECLKFAKSRGDKLVVAVNDDASVARLKGADRPICSLKERLDILKSLDCVDFVVSFSEDTPYEILKKINPDLIVKGGDYKKNEVVGNDLFDVEIFNLVNCMSTSDKIKKLQNVKQN